MWTYRALGALDPAAELQAPSAERLFAFLAEIDAAARLRSVSTFTLDAAMGARGSHNDLLDFAELHRTALREHERTAFRLAWLLRARSAPLAGEGEFELGLRCLRIALAGRRALAAALADPPTALAAFSLDEAIGAFALLRPSWIRFHAGKAALRSVTLRGSAAKVPSFAPGILRVNARLAELFPDHSIVLPNFTEDRARGFVFSPPPLAPQPTA